jgi:hypothetical protein
MKTMSKNRDYIDYTHDNSGVRVWKNRCQAISRQDETHDWMGQEEFHPIPVPDSILGFPHSGASPANALAFEVARYDDKERDPELRGLLKGWMAFEDAFSTRPSRNPSGRVR